MSKKLWIVLILIIAGLGILFFSNRTNNQPVNSVLSEAEARVIAEKSCVKGGEVLAGGTYNENSKTWWYDANLNATREGCNPACVVSEETKTAEINWRCTGLKEPKACTMEAKLCPDGSAVGRSGPDCEFAECPNVPANEMATAVLGQRILNGGVYITPLSVVSDSRCPADVQCIWAGEILIKVKLEKGAISKEVELKERGSVVFEGNNVSFISLIPENKTKPATPQEDYQFTFKVVTL